MFKIEENEIGKIVHNLLSIVSVIKAIEADGLTTGQKEILHGAETRLQEIRQQLLESLQENGNSKNKENKKNGYN